LLLLLLLLWRMWWQHFDQQLHTPLYCHCQISQQCFIPPGWRQQAQAHQPAHKQGTLIQ
jgi:hypothetical protein